MLDLLQVPVDGGYEDIKIASYKYRDNLIFRDSVVASTNPKKPKIIYSPIFLDTETSHDKKCERGWIYQWAFRFQKKTFVGRKPSDLIKWLDYFRDKFSLSEKKKIVIYIHNLSYDYQYLREFFDAEYGRPENVLALKSHRIVSVSYSFFEMRCTYLLSNSSLYDWGNAYHTKHRKLLGAVDYDVIRYQNSRLTLEDWQYQILDVLTMEDCWYACKEGYTIQTIPLTSTGFIRKESRDESKKDKNNRKRFIDRRLDATTYRFARREYQGGYSHGNRRFIAWPVIGMIGHRDFTSFYPSIMMLDSFPIGKFILYFKFSGEKITDSEIWKAAEDNCLLMRVLIKDMDILEECTAPCISLSKLERYQDSKWIHDNGRILQYRGYCEAYMTELDYMLFREQYRCSEITVLEIYASARGKLPNWLRNVTMHYFYLKSYLKEMKAKAKAEGNKADYIRYDIELMKAKNRLNAIYGMCCTDPVRDEFKYDYDLKEWIINKNPNIEEALDKFYNSRNSFMPYQYGIYVTSWARYHLIHDMIKNTIGYENYIYSDTDSIFYKSNPEIEKRLDEWNQWNDQRCEDAGEYAEVNGRHIYFMGFYDENENITEFKFLHSKCYAYKYLDKEGKKQLSTTIAGVSRFQRRDGGLPYEKRRTREDELQDAYLDLLKVNPEADIFDAFSAGMVYKECGGLLSTYIEEAEVKIERINGHMTEYASACIIQKNEKTLNDMMAQPEMFEYIIDYE